MYEKLPLEGSEKLVLVKKKRLKIL